MKNMKLFKTEEEQQLFFSLWAKAREAAEVAPSRVCPEDAAAGLSSVRGMCCVGCDDVVGSGRWVLCGGWWAVCSGWWCRFQDVYHASPM